MVARPVIAHVMHSLGVGGLENGVVNLVNHAGIDFRHVIVCTTGAGPLRDRLRPAVEVLTLGKRPGHDARAFARLVALLRRIRPAIVHSRNWPALDAIPAARLAGVRLVVHGEHGREAADPEGRDRRRNWARRALSPLVSRFVTVSDDLRRWVVEDIRLPAHKVTTIHNGVDVSRFGNASRPEARTLLALPPDAHLVGTVGRLDPIKDQAGLIRAFASLSPASRDALLLIVGDGPCRSTLERHASELGIADRVRFLGNRLDVATLLAALDVFVLPSIAEGMSNTILEAMATGLPVVATRVGGNPELVEDGSTGTLVTGQDPGALARAITAYLDDSHLRALHGKASRQRAVERFGLDRMCAQYGALYCRLLAGTAPRGA